MNEEKIYAFNALEIIRRGGQYYLRCNAGTHNEAWREDEISEQEVAKIKSGSAGRYEAMIGLQKRLISSGIDPYISNWTPSGPVGE